MARRPIQLDAAALRAEITAGVDAELARITAAEEEHRATLAELSRQAEEVRAEHGRVAEAARRDLKAVPVMPELPDGQPERDALASLAWARKDLAARQMMDLAAALPKVVSSWEAARPDLDGRARDIADAAEALALEYAAWWSLLHDVRRAEEHRDPNVVVNNGASQRMRPRPTAASVLGAAAGTDLCGVLATSVPFALITGDAMDGSGRAERNFRR